MKFAISMYAITLLGFISFGLIALVLPDAHLLVAIGGILLSNVALLVSVRD